MVHALRQSGALFSIDSAPASALLEGEGVYIFWTNTDACPSIRERRRAEAMIDAEAEPETQRADPVQLSAQAWPDHDGALCLHSA